MEIRSSNPHDPRRILLGHVTLTTDRQFTDRGYECAAWWQTITVPAGRYPVTTNGYYAFIHLPGVVTECYFGSLWGGVAISAYDTTQNDRIGTDARHHLETYLYGALAILESDQFDGFTLADGITHRVDVRINRYAFMQPHRFDRFEMADQPGEVR